MEVEMDVAAIHHNHHHHHHHHHQQHHQQQTLESMLHVCTKSQEDKKPPPPPPEQPLKCPRCDSSNTKFCYYNNYSLTQPRYFCKACRRYWTKGGTLRNVPVGGGCRKSNKRNSSSSANSCSASLKMRGPQQLQPNFTSASNSNHLLAGLPYDSSTCSDLSLAFARLQRQQQNIGSNIGNLYDHFDQIDHHLCSSNNIEDQLGFIDNNNNNINSNTTNLWYNGGGNNIGNGDHLINPMFHDHQEQELKQELACNMMRPAEVGLMGFPWNMVESGNMVHEVESGRSMIGGYWNGIGGTNWHGLINSPLM